MSLTKRFRLWLKKSVIPWAGPALAAAMIRLIASTIRFKIDDPAGALSRQASPSVGPLIFAFWHNRILLMPAIFVRYGAGRRLVVMISQSRDGSLIADTAARFGIEAARGSTSGRGISAFRRMSRFLIEESVDVGVTPDGPRGPRYAIQKGVIHLARLTQRPIIPVSYRCSGKWEMPSWDRFQIPHPFTTCHIIVHPPIAPDHPNPAQALKEALADSENT